MDIGKIIRRIEVDPTESPELPMDPVESPLEPSPEPSAPLDPIAPGR